VPARSTGAASRASPATPSASAAPRRRSRRSPRNTRASAIAQIGIVNVTMAAREVVPANCANTTNRLKPATDNKAAATRRGH